jgi:2-octaprenyl-6-methoxyphenol hydroxylase
MKNKIYKYDFLIVGAGLVGSLAAIALHKKKYKVLVIEKNKLFPKDERTLAVNANSRDFLRDLGIWKDLKSNFESIDKIIIKDYLNKEDLIFHNDKESMGSVIFNQSLLKISREYLIKNKILLTNIDFESFNFKPKKTFSIHSKYYMCKKIIFSLGKNYENHNNLKKNIFDSGHKAYVGFFKHQKNHNQTAYEIFTPSGPLAVLPSPSLQKKSSTFIFSSKNKMSLANLSTMIKNNFYLTHGNIYLSSTINHYPIKPHLSRPSQKDILLIGDTAHSIHPVAGQGWNLGIKDIKTLCSCLDKHNINDTNFDEYYFSKRITENFIYLTFTNTLNHLYENQTPISKSIIKASHFVLSQFPNLRNLFIKQAMGKTS